MNYTVPANTKIGHVHLKVSDIGKALTFYKDLLGFTITQSYGTSAVFLSAGGYHHHIALNTWYSQNGKPSPASSVGLFHAAIVYSTRKELAMITRRILESNYPITGAADHGVSEAIYLNDPDGNGIELYWDKPHDKWPIDAEGNLQMISDPLNINLLLEELS